MTVPFGREGLIDDTAELAARFPLPPALAQSYSLAGRQAFADAFIAARDRVEADYYAVVRELGLTNVEIRRGDIFDPAVTEDLVGQADAMGAIEVILHFPPPSKVVGMRTMASLLRPGGVLCLLDSAIAKPLGAFAERFYANQSIYFGQREQYFRLFDEARLLPVGYVDHSPNMAQTFKDTTRVLRTYRPQLEREFGWIMSRLWPEVPGRLYVPTLRNLRYVHVVGARRHDDVVPR